jgi:hypothetical protein
VTTRDLKSLHKSSSALLSYFILPLLILSACSVHKHLAQGLQTTARDRMCRVKHFYPARQINKAQLIGNLHVLLHIWGFLRYATILVTQQCNQAVIEFYSNDTVDYRLLFESAVRLGCEWTARKSIVRASELQFNDVYAEVPLWSASGPIARRWIVPTWIWKLSDCKNWSEWWKIATRSPVGRIL